MNPTAPRRHAFPLIAAAAFSFTAVDPAAALQERKAFKVPLADLMVSMDRAGRLEEVFVSFGSVHEGWAVSAVDDRYVKDTRKMRLDHTYRELPTQAHLISPFEARILDRVLESFSETLLIYERDLRGENWGRLLYLDAYLPAFYKGFYYLFTSMRNSVEALPAATRIPDSEFDHTYESPKSDLRIDAWRKDPEHVMKLRIAAKELAHQIKVWRKKEVGNSKRDPWADHSTAFVDAYDLLIRLYFGLPPRKK